jgi:hypothetical protein
MRPLQDIRLLLSLAWVPLLAASCGGGGNDSVAATPIPITTPAPTPSPAPATGTTMPRLSVTPIQLAPTNPLGTPNIWPNGDTVAGGQGQSIDGIDCANIENYHVHTHLAIFRNGEMLTIPAAIGLTGCTYELHTHDWSGILHVEAPAVKRFTLGQFFAVWGQPLSSSNVAGITGLPVVVYINDGTSLIQYLGNPADIELISHRSITIQIGTALTEIPSYTWDSAQ